MLVEPPIPYRATARRRGVVDGDHNVEAVKRLVPARPNEPNSTAVSYAMARFMLANRHISAAIDARDVKVPTAMRFLDKAKAALEKGIADLAVMDAYVDGANETPKQTYERMIKFFGDLDALLLECAAFFDIKKTWDQESL